MTRPIIALAGLTACSGCQLTLVNCEVELPEIASAFDIAYFPMGESRHHLPQQIDVAFVEGAVSTPEDLDLLLALRNRSNLLVAFGTCAVWGGVAAMKNEQSRLRLAEHVYGLTAQRIATFNPGPFKNFVQVDFTITGCPPEKHELIMTLGSLLQGAFPVFSQFPVCTECRNRENLCLLIERDEMCFGPIIQAGCNARCPTVGIRCEGCRGPFAEANVAAEMEVFRQKGFSLAEITSRIRRFCPEWNYEQRH